MNYGETAAWFDCAGERLLGLLSTPAHRDGDTGVLVVVGGPQYRAGSHRQFVALARRLASAGYPCLRFDVRGMGDSEGAQRSFEALDEDISAAIDHLFSSCPSLRRIVLWGLCDGASAALLYQQRTQDARVGGMVLLNPWVRSTVSLARTHVRHYYLDRLRQPQFWRKLITGKVAIAAVSGLISSLGKAFGPGRADPMRFQARMAAGWAGFRYPILLLTSERDLTAQEFLGLSASDPAWQLALRLNQPHHVVLTGADHTCAVPGTQALAEQAVLDWLSGLSARRHPETSSSVAMPLHPQDKAIVVGLCGHGLALARALTRNGVQVLTLEQSRELPGTATNCTELLYIDDINAEGLVDHLLSGNDSTVQLPQRQTLLLTNDRMVATVARHIDRLVPRYNISWAHCASDVLRLLRKDEIEAQCRANGLRYPRTVTVTTLSQIDTALDGLNFPIIFKPTQPISAFKTIVVHEPSEISGHLPMLQRCLPVIAQEFIAGDDRNIHFGALLLDHGQVLCRFEGRKLRSRPMGHTTIAVPEIHAEVHALTLQFFAGLNMSGPVSLELKRDPAGNFWVIEPTVGRTDFWIDVAVHNGVNIPLLEHQFQAGLALAPASQTSRALWLNGERDSMGLLWMLRHEPARLLQLRVRGLYFDLRDLQPFVILLGRRLIGTPRRVLRKLFGSA